VNILLSGIVGSTAYGLANEHSDIDRLGVYAAPTEEFTPRSAGRQVSGTYRECQACHAPPIQPPLPEGWTVSLHRAPNPQGSHLKTEEPIYITMHTPVCSREQR
jgi:hypothetical protein